MNLPKQLTGSQHINASMVDLSYRPDSTTLLILLGVGLFAIGAYGANNTIGTRAGCLSLLSVFDVKVVEVTPQTLTYENGCNSFSGPTYAALWPVGFIAILLGGGSKIDQLLDKSALWTGIATVLFGVTMLVVGGVFGLLPIVLSLVFGFLGLAWLRMNYRSPI